MAAQRKAALFDAFYAGQKIEEFDRKVVVAIDDLVEDLFDIEEDDLRAAMERYEDGNTQKHNP